MSTIEPAVPKEVWAPQAVQRMASLETQLREAREAGRSLSGKLLDAVLLGEQFKAERDAAIERGNYWQRWALAAAAKWTWFVTPAYRYILNLMCQTYSDGKQEARDIKRDAKAKGALAEKWLDALRGLCRGHNARGSDGPCGCMGCRLIASAEEPPLG